MNKDLYYQSSRSFEEAVTKLNPLSFKELCAVSCVLSCVEFFNAFIDSDGCNLIFNFLNYKTVSMFDKALLCSKANLYKDKCLTKETMNIVLDRLLDAQNTPELIESNLAPEQRVIDLFTKLVNDQCRLQKKELLTDISRIYALYYFFPEKYKEEIKEKTKNHYVDIPNAFELKCDITIRKYLLIGAIILQYYNNIFNNVFYLSNANRSAIKQNTKNIKFMRTAIWDNIESSKTIRNKLFFTVDLFQVVEKAAMGKRFNLSRNDVKTFLDLLSRTKKELNINQKKFPFSKGPYTYQMCVLEKYPVVKIEESASNLYIVPNLRYFLNSFSQAPHFRLQEEFKENQYNESFGYIFERYLGEYIDKRIRNVKVIPEQIYKKRKIEVHGPDFTIIDNINNFMIVVEAKSKSVSLDSRLTPFSSNIIEDLNGAFQALEKLPGKIKDLYHGYEEYSEWQEYINLIPPENIFCLIVIKDGIYLQPIVLHELSKSDKNNIMNTIIYKYALMDLADFEKCLELSYHREEPLIRLLIDFYEDSKKEGLSLQQSANNFKGRTVGDSCESFLYEYLALLIDGDE